MGFRPERESAWPFRDPVLQLAELVRSPLPDDVLVVICGRDHV